MYSAWRTSASVTGRLFFSIQYTRVLFFFLLFLPRVTSKSFHAMEEGEFESGGVT